MDVSGPGFGVCRPTGIGIGAAERKQNIALYSNQEDFGVGISFFTLRSDALHFLSQETVDVV